jgi:uncharacterized protein (TIGR00369 family)
MAKALTISGPTPTHSRALLEADGWVTMLTSSFVSHVGPVWTKMDDDVCRFVFVVEAKHDNTQRRSHGGMIMALCDDAMGNSARAIRPNGRLFTATFDCQFISGAEEGEFVEARCEVVKSTRSLVFMRSICSVGRPGRGCLLRRMEFHSNSSG